MMLFGCLVFCTLAVGGCEGLDVDGTLVLLGNTDFLIETLYLALFTSIATSFLAMYSLKELEAARVGIIQTLSVVVAVAAGGVLVLQETFLIYHAVATVLIVAGG